MFRIFGYNPTVSLLVSQEAPNSFSVNYILLSFVYIIMILSEGILNNEVDVEVEVGVYVILA